MTVSFIILALISSLFCASAIEKQLNNDIREELGRLKTEIRKLETEFQQRLGKVDSLAREVNYLRWLLKEQKTERSKWLHARSVVFLSFFLFFFLSFFVSKQGSE